MTTMLRPSAIVPEGFRVEQTLIDGTTTIFKLRPVSETCRCPGCGSSSKRAHSHYQRRVADLPLSGRSVRLLVEARRFRCTTDACRQKIFTEQFEAAVLAPRAARLERLVHHLGLALGSRPAANFAQRLLLPVSNDTRLRVVRRQGRATPPPPTVIGIDDWAWKRNQRYGAIICDLERRRPIRLLPDREPATAQAWLAQQPQIMIVARDRGAVLRSRPAWRRLTQCGSPIAGA